MAQIKLRKTEHGPQEFYKHYQFDKAYTTTAKNGAAQMPRNVAENVASQLKALGYFDVEVVEE